jgi:hypothetical protein
MVAASEQQLWNAVRLAVASSGFLCISVIFARCGSKWLWMTNRKGSKMCSDVHPDRESRRQQTSRHEQQNSNKCAARAGLRLLRISGSSITMDLAQQCLMHRSAPENPSTSGNSKFSNTNQSVQTTVSTVTPALKTRSKQCTSNASPCSKQECVLYCVLYPFLQD